MADFMFIAWGNGGLTDVQYAFYDSSETIIGSYSETGVQEGSAAHYSVYGVTVPSNARTIRWKSVSVASVYGSDIVFAPSDIQRLQGTAFAPTTAGKIPATMGSSDYSGNVVQTGDPYAYLVANLGALGAAATGLASAVWAVGTRLLTGGTNIVLAKGTGVTGFNDIAAGQQMDLVNAPNATAITAIQSGLSKPGTAQTITPADTAAATTAQGRIATLASGVNVTQIAGQTASAAGAVTFPGTIGTSNLGGTAQTGDAFAIVNSGTFGNAQLSRPSIAQTITPADTTAAQTAQSTIATNLNATVSSRSTLAAGAQMDLVNSPNSTALAALATAFWTFATRTLSAFGFTVSANAVSLPNPAPSGYGSTGGGSSLTAAQVAAAILKTPANLLATDASGDVTVSGASQVILATPYVSSAGPFIIQPAPPGNASQCLVYGLVMGLDGNPAINVPLTFTLTGSSPQADVGLIDRAVITANTDSTGHISQLIQRNDMMTTPGSKTIIACAAAGLSLPVNVNTSTLDIATLAR